MRASYPTYKSTSIPWMPEMPEHWEVRKAKFIFRKEKREVREDDDVVTAFRDGQVTLRKNRREDGFTIAVHEIGYQGIRKGDLVIHGMDAFAGAIGVSDSDGKASPVYNACTLRVEGNMNYFCHAIRQMSKSGFIQSLAKGIRERSTDFRYDTFGQQYLPFPPLTEQTAIANYLDAKSEQINRFIEKKETLIALLKEQKQAVINELLEDREGKWEKRKLKYCVTKVGSGITPNGGATVYKDSGIPLLRSQNIHNDKLELSDVAFISQEVHDSMSGSKVQAGDVLLNITGGSLGRCYYATEELGEANVNQHVSIIRPHPRKVKTQFLQLLLISEIGSKQIWREQTGSGREGLNGGAIKNFVFPMPKIEEQIEVISTIQKETSSIDAAIFQIEKEVDKVRELKQSLIAEVVTGLIKVV